MLQLFDIAFQVLGEPVIIRPIRFDREGDEGVDRLVFGIVLEEDVPNDSFDGRFVEVVDGADHVMTDGEEPVRYLAVRPGIETDVKESPPLLL